MSTFEQRPDCPDSFMKGHRFPMRSWKFLPHRTFHHCTGRLLLSLLLLCAYSCQSTSSTPESNPTSLQTSLSFQDSWKTPDSATWKTAEGSGTVAISATGQTIKFSFTIAKPLETGTEVWIGLWADGIRMGEILFAQERGKAELQYKEVARWDSVALKLLQSIPDLKQRNHDTVVAQYAKGLINGEPAFTGFPRTMPHGLDSSEVLIAAIVYSVSLGRSLESLEKNWLLGLSTIQLRPSVAKLVEIGKISVADTSVLFPPPRIRNTSVLAISEPLVPGGDAVKVMGSFAWIPTRNISVNYSIRTSSGIDSSHFDISQRRLPSPQDTTWILTDNVQIKAHPQAHPGIDTLVVTLLNDSGFSCSSFTTFHVAPKPDTTPPITLVVPATRTGITLPYETDSIQLIWTICDWKTIDTTSVRVGSVIASKTDDSTWNATIFVPASGRPTTLAIQVSKPDGSIDRLELEVVREKDGTAPHATRADHTRDTIVDTRTPTMDVAWILTDTDLKTVHISGEAVSGSLGVFHRSIPLVGDSVWATLVAEDSAGNQFRDSVKIRRLKPPTISPNGATLGSEALHVRFQSIAGVDSIEFSLDGTTWNTYKSDVVVTNSLIVYGRSRLGRTTSSVDSAIFLYGPAFSLASGPYSTPQAVQIDARNARLEISIDNGAWTSCGDKAAPACFLQVDSSVKIRARSSLGGTISPIASAYYAFPPRITPSNRRDTSSSFEISITSKGSDSVQVSLDSMNWSTLESGSFTMTDNGKLHVRSWIGGIVSPTATGTYSFVTSMPRLWPEPGVYASSQFVVLKNLTTGATIQYSLDEGASWKTYDGGTIPLYSGAPVTTSRSLRVRSFRNGSDTVGLSAKYGFGQVMWERDAVLDTMRDARTGQVYQTTKIGSQTWMAENLNFATDSSWCYELSADSCGRYGRIYQWASAMGLGTEYNNKDWTKTGKHQGVCPTGWHLPDTSDWSTLLGHASSDYSGDQIGIARSLKSSDGWLISQGLDTYGFNAMGSGYRDDWFGDFSLSGEWADWWASQQVSQEAEYAIRLGLSDADAVFWGTDMTTSAKKTTGLSVRCLKD